MSCIRGKDTKPEVLIRKLLFKKGYRYRLHQKDIPGKPDIVFPKYNAVILVNGCFWHYHECHLFKMPATDTLKWKTKLEGNRKRDELNILKLRESGWRVLVIWECSFKGKGKQKPLLSQIADKADKWLKSKSEYKQI